MKSVIIVSVVALFVAEAVFAADPACQTSIDKCKKDYSGLAPNSTTKDRCEKLGKALGCQNAMIKSTDCVGLNKKPDQALVLMYSQDCSDNSACDNAITKCKRDYAGLRPNSPLADKCEKVGKAVGCITAQLHSDVCVKVQRAADGEDQKLINTFNSDCGNATACEAGVNVCMQPVKAVIGDPDSAKNTDCPIIKKAVLCLNDMRLNSACKLVQHALLEGEKKIRQMDTGFCANNNNSGMAIQGSIVAVTLAVVLSFFK